MNKIKTRKELTDKEIISLLKKHKDLLKKYKVKRIGLILFKASSKHGKVSL